MVEVHQEIPDSNDLKLRIPDWGNLDGCSLLRQEGMVFSQSDSMLAGIFAIILSVSGFCLNALFILAILNHRRTRSHVTSVFMLSVSFADLWNSMFNLPVMAVRFISRSWMDSLGAAVCQIYPLSFYGTMGASLLSLTLITVNRAFLLFFPNKADKIFSNVVIICKRSLPINSLLLLFLCWMIPATILLLPTAGLYGDVGLNNKTQSCTILKDLNGHSVKGLVYIVGFVWPCSILFITNLLMFFKVRRMREDAKQRTSFRPDEDRRAEDKFIKMLGLVFLSFVSCFGPAMLVKSFDTCYLHTTLHILTYIINWCTVVVNPVVYFFMNDKYKAALTNLKSLVFGFISDGISREGRNTARGSRVQTIPKMDVNSSNMEQNSKPNEHNTGSETN